MSINENIPIDAMWSVICYLVDGELHDYLEDLDNESHVFKHVIRLLEYLGELPGNDGADARAMLAGIRQRVTEARSESRAA